MNPIAFAMRHPITMAMIVVALFGLGGLAIYQMRVDIFPEFNNPQIYIIQNYNGMSPEQIEGLLVNQIETNLQYVDGVKGVESQNIQQIALIKVSFYPDTDMSQAMAELVAQVNRAAAFMPKGVLPPQIMRMDPGSVPIGYLVLTSKSTSLGKLADLAEYNIRPLIQKEVPGTVGTAPFGANIRSIVVTVDPDRLRSYNLTPDDVSKALMEGNVVIPAGNLYIRDQMPMVPLNAMVDDIHKLEEIPLRAERNLYLRNVASVADATDLDYGYAMVDGKRSVYIPIVKKNTASALTVAREIRDSMPRFKSVLPEDVDIKYKFDQTPTVVEAIRSVATEGAIGACLTGLMVLIFLRDWRSVLVVVFNIPLALLGSLFGLWCTKNTINIMTLGGLALAIGMLVDEATVEVENIHAQMEHVKTIPRAVRLGNSITAVPRLLAMLCILSVFIPAFIMKEPMHSLFVPLSLAVGFSMITSYLLSSTLVPVLATWLLKGPKELKDAEEQDGEDERDDTDKGDERAQDKYKGFFGRLRWYWHRLWEKMMSLWPLNKLRHHKEEHQPPPHPQGEEHPHEARHEHPPEGDAHRPSEHRRSRRGGRHPEPTRAPRDRPGQGEEHGEGQEEWMQKGFFGKVQRVHVGIVSFSIAWRWIVVSAYLAACLLILVFVGMELGRELFPVTDMGQFVLRFRMPPGTNYQLTREAWVECLHTIQEEAGAGNVEISMGFAGQQAPNYAMNNMILFMRGPDDGQMRVKLREDSGVAIFPLQEKLRKALPERLKPWLTGVLRKEGYSAVDAKERADRLQFGFEPGDIVSEVMSFGSPTPIEVLASSHHLEDARAFQEKVMAALHSNQSLRDLQFHQELDYPTIRVNIDRQKANLSGVTTEEVGRSVLEATSSSRMLYRNYWIDKKSGRSYQVQVQTPIARMTSESQVETLPLQRVSPGLNLMVRDVAHVGRSTMPGEFDRTQMQRYVSITANVEGEDLGRAAKQIEEAVQKAGQPPRGVHLEHRGQVKPMNQMFESLAIGLAAAVFVILVLLTAYFQSPRLALISIGAVPGVLCGVVLLLLVTKTTLNIESFMGTIMSVGVSVSNSVMLVTFISMEWQKGTSVHDSAIRGAGERLRPILMTACAMTIGMVPMSLGLESGSKMEAPLAIAVIGGLVLSTFATLLILPAIYSIVMGDRKYEQPSIDPEDPESKYFDGGEEAQGGDGQGPDGGKEDDGSKRGAQQEQGDGHEQGPGHSGRRRKRRRRRHSGHGHGPSQEEPKDHGSGAAEPKQSHENGGDQS
jgi:multidrug efflux pump subunit AcrB